jgi:hypothetical protein
MSDGKMVMVHLFCMRLLASKDFFVMAILNEQARPGPPLSRPCQ